MSTPLISIEWEPYGDGTLLILQGERVDLNQISVRELRDDMEEADFLSRGYEKLDLMMSEIEYRDKVRILGQTLSVASVLEQRDNFTVLQFLDISGELVLPSDEQVTVYRVIE